MRKAVTTGNLIPIPFDNSNLTRIEKCAVACLLSAGIKSIVSYNNAIDTDGLDEETKFGYFIYGDTLFISADKCWATYKNLPISYFDESFIISYCYSAFLMGATIDMSKPIFMKYYNNVIIKNKAFFKQFDTELTDIEIIINALTKDRLKRFK